MGQSCSTKNTKTNSPAKLKKKSSKENSAKSYYSYASAEDNARSRTGTQLNLIRAAENQDYGLANRNTVLVAAYKGNIEEVTEHLSKGFPTNFPLNDSGWTLMHIAADKGDMALLTLLLECGAEIDITENAENWTPLMVAAMSRKYETVEVLLRKGAKHTMKDKSNKTAMELAMQYGSIEVGKCLARWA